MRRILSIIALAVMFFAQATASAQQASDTIEVTVAEQAIYIFRNDGQMNVFFDNDVEKMCYSRIDTLGIEHSELVTQEVHTIDSIYRIPLSAIDSVSYVRPETRVRHDVRQIPSTLRHYQIEAAEDHLLLSYDIPGQYVPEVGQVLLTRDDEGRNIFGRVRSVEYKRNGILIEFHPDLKISEIFDRLCLYETTAGYAADEENNTPALVVHRVGVSRDNEEGYALAPPRRINVDKNFNKSVFSKQFNLKPIIESLANRTIGGVTVSCEFEKLLLTTDIDFSTQFVFNTEDNTASDLMGSGLTAEEIAAREGGVYLLADVNLTTSAHLDMNGWVQINGEVTSLGIPHFSFGEITIRGEKYAIVGGEGNVGPYIEAEVKATLEGTFDSSFALHMRIEKKGSDWLPTYKRELKPVPGSTKHNIKKLVIEGKVEIGIKAAIGISFISEKIVKCDAESHLCERFSVRYTPIDENACCKYGRVKDDYVKFGFYFGASSSAKALGLGDVSTTDALPGDLPLVPEIIFYGNPRYENMSVTKDKSKPGIAKASVTASNSMYHWADRFAIFKDPTEGQTEWNPNETPPMENLIEVITLRNPTILESHLLARQIPLHAGQHILICPYPADHHPEPPVQRAYQKGADVIGIKCEKGSAKNNCQVLLSVDDMTFPVEVGAVGYNMNDQSEALIFTNKQTVDAPKNVYVQADDLTLNTTYEFHPVVYYPDGRKEQGEAVDYYTTSNEFGIDLLNDAFDYTPSGTLTAKIGYDNSDTSIDMGGYNLNVAIAGKTKPSASGGNFFTKEGKASSYTNKKRRTVTAADKSETAEIVKKYGDYLTMQPQLVHGIEKVYGPDKYIQLQFPCEFKIYKTEEQQVGDNSEELHAFYRFTAPIEVKKSGFLLSTKANVKNLDEKERQDLPVAVKDHTLHGREDGRRKYDYKTVAEDLKQGVTYYYVAYMDVLALQKDGTWKDIGRQFSDERSFILEKQKARVITEDPELEVTFGTNETMCKFKGVIEYGDEKDDIDDKSAGFFYIQSNSLLDVVDPTGWNLITDLDVNGVFNGRFKSLPESLKHAQKYCVAAFVKRKDGSLIIGNIKQFETVEHDCTDYVDLGLSVYWARCNVGACEPYEYGDYYSWGELMPKSTYRDDNYTDPGVEELNKYNPASECVDRYSDAAFKWDERYWIPTVEQWEELMKECDWEWVSNYERTGVAGYKVKARKENVKGNFIFLPASGNMYEDRVFTKGKGGCYWSNHVVTEEDKDRDITKQNDALRMHFLEKDEKPHIEAGRKFYGRSIRGVTDSSILLDDAK